MTNVIFLTDICFLLIYGLLSVVGYKVFKHKVSKGVWPKVPVNILALWVGFRTLLTLAYYWLSTNGMVADSAGYFKTIYNSSEGYFNMIKSLGNEGVYVFLYPMVQWLGLGYLSCMLLFNLLGTLGMFLIYSETRKYITSPKIRQLQNGLLFMPSLAYFTCAIGKDSLVILGLGLVISSFHLIRHRWGRVVLGGIIVLWVRPHIYMVLALAAIITLFLRPNKTVKELGAKISICIVLIALVLSTYSTILNYVGLKAEELSVEYIEKQIEFRGTVNEGNSAIAVTNYSIPVKLITYLVRPLFFDAKNPLMFIVSFENLVILYLLTYLLRPKILKKIKSRNDIYTRFNLIYFWIGLTLLAIPTGNLGIAVRQKTMVLPSILIVILIALSDVYVSKNTHQKKLIKTGII